MFAVLSGEAGTYKNGGVFRKGYQIKTVSYQGGSYVLAELTSKKVKWKKLRAELGNTASRAVLCRDMVLPDSCGITPIDTSEIGYVFLKNAVGFWLGASEIPIQKRSATLIDLRGVYHDLARTMAKDCALLKVVTLHRESYDHLSAELRMEFGAVLQVTDLLDRPNDNMMLVSPKGFGADFAGAVTVPIITLEPDAFKHANIIHGFARERFDEFKLELPERVDELAVAAALHTIGTRVELKGFLPDRCVLNNEAMTLQNTLEKCFSLDTASKI